ncbi:MAG TPA: rhomboid family intramembrane serine protease [Fimbriimonadales bacterium]|nr:rhomboid family intramembrane serine protease [Fimbriimonadales bacterium]
MIPIRERGRLREFPFVTYTLVILLIVIYLWDREWSLFGERVVFTDLAVRPVDVIRALYGGDKEPLITLFTSAFLHGNIAHLLSNLIFLVVFAPRVEVYFGAMRFALYYLFWGVAAAFTQIIVMPDSGTPMLGASGAIAGVMGSYLLLFPGALIEVIIPPLFFWTFYVPAWVMLTLWFVFQIFSPQIGVANWAHAGGFLAGMIIVMLTGNRERARRLRPGVY